MRPRVQEHYEKVVVERLMKEFGYGNRLAVPRLNKIVLNAGVGEAKKAEGAKALENMGKALAAISGQKPVTTLAKKSIANFGIRRGQTLGCKVTLRGVRMYEFVERLVHVALPRVRDFRGVSPQAFDGRGTYTLGIREHGIFPEVKFEWIDKVRGMNVTFVTTARTDQEAKALLAHLGLPFRGN
ncbi:MAG: 50S ribosomal protein L5 [Nitrospirae bacterium]|nr:50S ribosomal protein L5 [Nitrospirota bacterium]